MAQGVGGSRFADSAGHKRLLEGSLQVLAVDMAVFFREKITRSDPLLPAVVPQQFQWAVGQMDIAMFAPFAEKYPELPPFAVNIADRKPHRFGITQTAGIDERQGHPIDRMHDLFQDALDFLNGQNHRQFLGPERLDHVKYLPGPLQGGFIEKLDTAQIDGDRAGGRLPSIDHVEEKTGEATGTLFIC